ncbi:hypothetical protein IID10_18320, partial [candidate division KSB1 bacterium]|nr:hypothetical protein [candidate division KSB1 bacterium]
MFTGLIEEIGAVEQIQKHRGTLRFTISAKEVVRKVAEFYDITEQNIYEKTRRKEVVKQRQLIMYILREDFGISYTSIGQ